MDDREFELKKVKMNGHDEVEVTESEDEDKMKKMAR